MLYVIKLYNKIMKYTPHEIGGIKNEIRVARFLNKAI